ncbi:hypothetical protein SUGI_0369100 [Cryptomeria japonica]|nr:hypothetical protein SUGI_0369100 [Cryptomeria japonica]
MATERQQPNEGIDAVTHQLKHILPDREELLNVKDQHGNAALHIAVGRNYVHIIKQLIEFQLDLCYCTNDDHETPICIAAKLGHLEAVKELIEIVLSELVNQGLEKPQTINERDEKPQITTSYPPSKIEPLEIGDTPLHIAARTKNFHMVVSLLNIPGIDKEAFNKAGLTALDIVRENTEYYESYRIIALLANYPPKSKPFLYSTSKEVSRRDTEREWRER